MFDVDPKWAELVKERGNLPHDLQKRLPQSDRKKGPGRPPLLSSPPSATSQASPLPTSNLPFPNLATAGLGAINPSTLLSGLSLGGFDPKNNPLLLPFGGMPNMSALSGMGGLGNMNLTNSLFANLAGLGLPNLAGMDGVETSGSSTSPGTSKPSKPRKSESSPSSKNTPVSSAASSLPSSLPFFFPNPSLLYTPLGLGGLNPFSLQPGSMSSAYDSLALLNGGLGVSSASQASTRPHKSTATTTTAVNVSSTMTTASSSASSSRSASTVTSSSSSRQQRPQFMLPHDTHLLETLARSQAAQRPSPRSRDTVDSLRNLMSGIPPFTNKTREQEMKDALETLSKSSAEFLARMPSQEDRGLKRSRDESPFIAVDLANAKKLSQSSPPTPKRVKESPLPSPTNSKKADESASSIAAGIDLSNHSSLTPATTPTPTPTQVTTPTSTPTPTPTHMSAEERVKSPPPVLEPKPVLSSDPVETKSSLIERVPSPELVAANPPSLKEVEKEEEEKTVQEEAVDEKVKAAQEQSDADLDSLPLSTLAKSSSSTLSNVDSTENQEESPNGNKGARRRQRNKKPTSDVVERKVLRSSAGRAAAAAAARAAKAQQNQPDAGTNVDTNSN